MSLPLSGTVNSSYTLDGSVVYGRPIQDQDTKDGIDCTDAELDGSSSGADDLCGDMIDPADCDPLPAENNIEESDDGDGGDGDSGHVQIGKGLTETRALP